MRGGDSWRGWAGRRARGPSKISTATARHDSPWLPISHHMTSIMGWQDSVITQQLCLQTWVCLLRGREMLKKRPPCVFYRDFQLQHAPSETASERKLSFAYKRFGSGITVRAEWSDHKWTSFEAVCSHLALTCASTCITSWPLAIRCHFHRTHAHTHICVDKDISPCLTLAELTRIPRYIRMCSRHCFTQFKKFVLMQQVFKLRFS